MEVRNEIKKKGVGGSFTPYSRYKSSERNFSFALLMSLLSTGASLFIPMLTKGLVDNFSLSSISAGQIVGLVAFFVMQTIAAGLSIYLLNYIGQKIVAGLRERLWKRYLSCRYLITIEIEQVILLAV